MLNIRGVLFLYGLVTTASASVTSATQTASGTVTSRISTCPSRTANVITHNLPQQCLTSARKGADSPSLDSTVVDPAQAGLPSLAANASDVPTSDATSLPTTTGADLTSTDAVTALLHASVPDPASQSPSASTPAETDDPSPLDDGQFMSFEDWKKQNLQKAGQSEHLGKESPAERLSQRKRPASIHTALDTLGDDTEIELDFAGFMPGAPGIIGTVRQPSQPEPQHDPAEIALSSPPKVKSGSKDAGTTCKERFNYASFDCAANILKSNPEATSSSAVLGENKDAYMLNVCSADNKLLILELCDDISIDTIVLANYEFFSSIFRTFRVSVSDKYPVKADKWKSLGTFEARNTREVQAFLVENPVIWARYVRIEFLTHYGNEYYCPVSLVRVHGTTMLEEYKHDLESAQGDGEDEPEVVDSFVPPEDALVPEAVADGLKQDGPVASVESSQDTTSAKIQHPATPGDKMDANGHSRSPASVEGTVPTGDGHSTHVSGSDEASQAISSTSQSTMRSAVVEVGPAVLGSETSLPTSVVREPVSKVATETPTDTSSSQSSLRNSHSASVPFNSTSTNVTQSANHFGSSTNATSTDRPKSSGTATQGAPAVPTMQESFFKSVQKRLQMLESNSSLSLQYIEDQSRALRDAFNKVEQRQLTKTTSFLDHLNVTVLSELREFRQQYDQLWQSTVIELEMQRERYHHETEAMNARLGILADELIFQKRISILQMMLVLVCLALVLFTKGAFDQYLELPLVQSVLARSPSSRWLHNASLDTPTQSPPATRHSSLRKRHGILKGHRRVQSEDSIELEGSLSPNDLYSPPTPVSMSYGEPSDGEQAKGMGAALDDPEFDPSAIERPSTSPPELSGTTPSSPELEGLNEHESIESRLLNATPERDSPSTLPRVMVEQATPPPKRLSWRLPNEI